MADKSQIEWTDATWNPVTGCSRVSSGCGGPDGGGCYAERWAATRLRHHPSRRGLTDRHGRWTGEVRFNKQWLDQPLRWQKPRRIFVCAHSDLFHEKVPDEWIDSAFRVMAMAPRHIFQVLTKRPERARDYIIEFYRQRFGNRHPESCRWHGRKWPLSNVWMGTSAENRPTLEERLPHLYGTPAAVRWLSLEPLLGEIDLVPLFHDYIPIDWVVVGGESGPGARRMDPKWARSLRDQCARYEIPFFFKQWGGNTSKAGGCELDGRTWRQMPGAS